MRMPSTIVFGAPVAGCSLHRVHGVVQFVRRHAAPIEERLGTVTLLAGFPSVMETKMTDQPTNPLADEIEHLRERADRLEEQATRDGILPSPEAEGNGIGPQTGAVP